jgi:ATP-dependent DNA helicase DinG
MHGADLVIANHALVFADLALREAGVSVLPEYSCLILDEAHELEEGAASNFGASVSEIGIARQLGRFMGSKRRSGLFGRVEVGVELYKQLERVRKLTKSFFVQLDSLRGDAKERRLRGAVGIEDGLSQPIDRLVGMLRKEHDVISDEEVAMEWKARTDRLTETRDALRLIAGQLDNDLVYWVEQSGRRGRSVLRAAPDDVAPLLRRSLFSRTRCVVMTSATMRVGGSFAHFNRRVGLNEPVELAAGSPFDFERQCRLLLHPRLPDPRQRTSYDDAVAERVRDLVLEAGGGAFVLFTSYRALAAVHDAVRGDLDAAGLKVLRQGDTRPREILDHFRSSEDCVLFGTDTFWQGVDVRGRNLRLVVLTRLPFAVPDHPLQEARLERIEDRGGDPFRELSLPQAVLKLRQGFGRLIRTQEDHGTVAILDPRTHTKNYGRIFLDSLPRCAVEERA